MNDLLILKEYTEEGELEEKRSEIVSFFERLPKPTAIAMQEFLEGKLSYEKMED